MVSIHAPTWGATARVSTNKTANMFQSTLPRGERPEKITVVEAVEVVSIHAPTWGATHSHTHARAYMYVSIHAPTWGAT